MEREFTQKRAFDGRIVGEAHLDAADNIEYFKTISNMSAVKAQVIDEEKRNSIPMPTPEQMAEYFEEEKTKLKIKWDGRGKTMHGDFSDPTNVSVVWRDAQGILQSTNFNFHMARDKFEREVRGFFQPIIDKADKNQKTQKTSFKQANLRYND